MKKLFYLLFISFALASCTKEEPVEVVCTCGDVNSGCDASIVGYWKGTSQFAESHEMFIGQNFEGTWVNNFSNQSSIGNFSCADGHLTFNEMYENNNPIVWIATYSIVDGEMILICVGGDLEGITYTFTKQ